MADDLLFQIPVSEEDPIIRRLTRESKTRDQDIRNWVEKTRGLLAWWARKSDQYPYQVEIPLSLVNDLGLPELFDEYGAHICAHLRPGWRTYGFMDKKDADAFIRKYPQRAKHFQWGQTPSGLIIP